MSTQSTSSTRPLKPDPPPAVRAAPSEGPAQPSALGSSTLSHRSRPASYASAATALQHRTPASNQSPGQQQQQQQQEPGSGDDANQSPARGRNNRADSSGGGSRRPGTGGDKGKSTPSSAPPKQTSSTQEQEQETVQGTGDAGETSDSDQQVMNPQPRSVLTALPVAQSHNSFEVLQTIQGDDDTPTAPTLPLAPTGISFPPANASTAGDNTKVVATGSDEEISSATSAGGKPVLVRQVSHGQVTMMEVDTDNVFIRGIPDNWTRAMLQKHFTVNDVVPDIYEHKPGQFARRNVEVYYRDPTLAAQAIRGFDKSKIDDRNFIHVGYLHHRIDSALGTRMPPRHDRSGTPVNSSARALGAGGTQAQAQMQEPRRRSPLPATASDQTSSSMSSAATSDTASSDGLGSPGPGPPARSGGVASRLPQTRGGFGRGGGARAGGASTSAGAARRVVRETTGASSSEYQEKPKLDVEYLVEMNNIPYTSTIPSLYSCLASHAIHPYDIRKAYPAGGPGGDRYRWSMTPRQARSDHAGRVRLVFDTMAQAEAAADKLHAGQVWLDDREMHGRVYGVWRRGGGLEKAGWYGSAGPVGRRGSVEQVEDGVGKGQSTRTDVKGGQSVAAEGDMVEAAFSAVDENRDAEKEAARLTQVGEDMAETTCDVEASSAGSSAHVPSLDRSAPVPDVSSVSPRASGTVGPHGVFIDKTTQGTSAPGSPTPTRHVVPISATPGEPAAPTETGHDTDAAARATHHSQHPHDHYVHYAETVHSPPLSHVPHNTASHDGHDASSENGKHLMHSRSSTLPPNTFATPASPPHPTPAFPAHPMHSTTRPMGRPLGTPGTFYESSSAHMRLPHHHHGSSPGRGGGGGFRGRGGGSPGGFANRRGGSGYHGGGGGGGHPPPHTHAPHPRNMGEFDARHDSGMNLADAAGLEDRGATGGAPQAGAMAVPVPIFGMMPPGAVLVTGDGTAAYIVPPQMVMAAAGPGNAMGQGGGGSGLAGATSPRPSATGREGQAPQLGIAIRQLPMGAPSQQGVSQSGPAAAAAFPVHMHQPHPRVPPLMPVQQPFQHHIPAGIAQAHHGPTSMSSSPPPIPAHLAESSHDGGDRRLLTIPSPPIPYSARNPLTPIGCAPGDLFPVELHRRLGDMQLLHQCCLRVLGVHPDASPDDLEIVLMACAVRPYDICVDPTAHKLAQPEPQASSPQQQQQQHPRPDQVMIVQVLSSDLAQDVFIKDTNMHMNQAMAMVQGRKFMGRILAVQRFPWIAPMPPAQGHIPVAVTMVDAGVGTGVGGGQPPQIMSGGRD